MKKFQTSEDLDQVMVSIPLNKARGLLTMAFGAAEKVLTAIMRADNGEVNMGVHQRAAFQTYADDYKLLRDIISEAIVTNVSKEDQEAIQDHEEAMNDIVKSELVESIVDGAALDGCSNPKCEACVGMRKVVAEVKAKTEFDMTDFPEGTFIVPGSDEEN